jgi:MYXO-CTERM domain-containing protein
MARGIIARPGLEGRASMRCHHRIVVTGLLTALWGCGGVVEDLGADERDPDPTAEYLQRRSAIVGGTVDSGSPAVVALAVASQNGFIPFCTGTLIAGKTILSAAHCVNSYGTNAAYYAVFGTYVTSPTQYVRIVTQVRHPAYSSQSLYADIAVMRLETAVTNVTPMEINTQPLGSAWVGKPIRHSGFGVTAANTNTSGTKRHATYNIRQITETEIESGQSSPLKQTCSGDSGGPGFIILPNTTEEIVAGVVSYGDQNCNQFGVDTNVAYYASWVKQTMSAWEAPTCAEDGKCAANCPQPDVDCVCKADGVCSAECPDLAKDPDCPKDCVQNNVCAQDVCPVPDVDCKAEGQACTSELQCLWRKCVGDPQHSYNYCSRPCTSSTECTTAGMECAEGLCRYAQKPTANIGEPCDANTWCLLGGVCMGTSSADLYCALPCSGPGTCPGLNQSCKTGFNGQLFCHTPESTSTEPSTPRSNQVVLPHARVGGNEASQGCSATGGQPGWLGALGLLALGLWRRRRLRAGVLAVGLTAVCACGPTSSSGEGPGAPRLGASRSGIVGGSVTHGDPEVFMLRMFYSNNTSSSCTATLIGEQTLLTAAHCVDPSLKNATSVVIFATNETYANNAPQQAWIRVTEYRMHPSWNKENLAHDIALAYLQKAPGVEPKMWNTQSLTGLQNQPIRAAGYGITSRQKSDSGTKRHVDLTIAGLTQTHLYLGDQSSKGICSGDSGGPTFHVFNDGRERVVGVHSFDGNGVCTFGGDIRVDVYKSFIDAWMQEKEAPTCDTDGKCLLDCPQVDLDCYCVSDGACDARCPDLVKDPDCPVDCVQDGVCSLHACPVPDPDCVPDGLACQSPVVCTGRLCTTDPQHTGHYCSRLCTDDLDCGPGMGCYDGACRFFQYPEADEGEPCKLGATFCRDGTACTGRQGEPTTCHRPCSANSECQGGATCEYGQDYVRICQLPWKPEPTLPALNSVYLENEPGVGCTAAPGGLWGLWALAALAARRTRRRSTS